MRKELKGLRWKPAWISHMGCLAGCAEYLGVKLARPWLYGGTAHAFALNIHEDVCPSGPTAWDTRMIGRLAPNVGLGRRRATYFLGGAAPTVS